MTALQGIDLDIPNGMFGLLGPNGAGKTTLMRIVAGLLEATSGRITLDGEDLLESPERIWAQLGYLPQEFGFYPHLTGEQMLTYLLRMKGVEAPGGERRAGAALLEQVNLTFAARRKVKSYSGGMRQRLGHRAGRWPGNPRLIIVDEPTAGLDPEERHRLYRLLAELAADRIVLLSTHIVEDVAVLCPRFAVIRQGRLIANTTPGRAREAIAGMIFEGEIAASEMDGAAGGAACHAGDPRRGEEPRARLRAGGRAPSGFASVPATLEDAYLVMMRGNGRPEDGRAAAGMHTRLGLRARRAGRRTGTPGGSR